MYPENYTEERNVSKSSSYTDSVNRMVRTNILGFIDICNKDNNFVTQSRATQICVYG